MSIKSPTICLNMIVKDEAPVIERCVSSVRDLISHWVIVDTGSTDGTQEIIKNALKDVPGTLYERPWVNFGHNRTEAIELAAGKADYIFTIDADEYVICDEGFAFRDLSADGYMLFRDLVGLTYRNLLLVKDDLPWRWDGVLHEVLATDGETTFENLDGITIRSTRDGARASDPNTYRRDALLLEQALIDDPENTRHVFYLAQSYRDCSDNELALRWYRRRVEMGGWLEEIFMSKLNIAEILKRTEAPWPEQLAAYLAAHEVLPDRPEALYRLGMCCANRKDWASAWLFLHKAMTTKRNPNHILFLNKDIDAWRAKLEASVAAFYLYDFQTCLQYSEELLDSDVLPDYARENVTRNIELAKDNLK